VVAVLVLEGVDVFGGGFVGEAGLLLHDGVQGGVNVFGHVGGVATDVDAGTFLEPLVENGSLLEHSILDVDLALLIAGEGEVEAGEVPVVLHGFELFAVEEVGGGAALAEEEPVATGGAKGTALVQEGAEGSDAGARPDHDDGGGGVGGEAESLVGLNVDRQGLTGGGAIGEQGGADATAVAVVRAVADDGDSGVDFACMRVGAGRDGVEARDEARQHGDEVGWFVQNAGVVVEEVDETAVVGVFLEVSLLLGDEEAGEGVAFVGLFSNGDVGLDHLAGEAGDLEMVEKRVVKSGGSGSGELDGNLTAEVEGVEDLFDEAEVVPGDDSAGVTGLVGYIGVADVEGEMKGELAGDVVG